MPATGEQRDAVVIGAGPNGLVAANLLADAGWDVLVLEAQPTVGGAVRSDGDVAAGFVHDTFSSFYPLAAASPTIQRLHLERHGLVWRHAPAVLGTPFDDGTWAMLHRDAHATAAGLDAHGAGDGGLWLELVRSWEVAGDSLIGALLTPFPPVRSALGLVLRLPKAGGLSFVQLLVSSVQAMAERFRSEHAKVLLAGNAAHADLPAEALGSGLMGLLLAMLGQTVGYPVPEGGAGRLAAALETRLLAAGGEIRCDARVARVVVEKGRAVAVHTADGTRIGVKEAVLADVVAPHLYGGLVPWDDLPTRLLSRMRRFEWDPSTVKVDWALNGPIPWASAPTSQPGTVHVTESVDHVVLTGAEVAAAHRIPAEPLLLVGQMTTTDPTRSPPGTESVWAYTHVPQQVKADLGDGSIRGTWDAADGERMADRMQARMERYAPGFGSRVIARRVLTPPELERRNESLVGGAINGGTAGVHQQLVFRPVAGLGRSETPVKGLYLASASAHPGGGVHGACGSNAARAALWHAKIRRR